jgi:hypothetical protein
MYGELPKYVQRMGFSPRFVPSPLKWPDISGLRVLVLVMPLPQRPLARPECEAVWKHVRLGGSLLVVGDHTGGSGFARGMNELLAPTGMRLNSDASWPRAAHWWGQLDLAPHGAAAGGGRLASADGTGVNVGGTISTRWPATPVLVGKAGWADEGDPTNAAEGCLGNSVREEGERVGDLVLCSATRFGLGKVMLFGDSSSFQNSALSNSYGFVCDVLYWLSSRRVHSAWRGNALIAILLVAAAWWSMRRTAATPLWVCAVGVSICVAQAACLAGRAPVTPPPARGGPPIALIDTSHLNMLSGATVQGDAYWGLLHCLMRDGFLPLMARTFDAEELAQGAVLVVPAPLATFSPDDVRRCLDWVRKGGRLVLTVGHEQVGAALPLLRRLGVSVDPTPMGRTEASWGREEVQFYEAWPVRADQPGARVLLSDGDTPLALERRVGKGTALVIGDSFFLLDKNLEGLDKWYLGNIHFLRSWLQRPDEGGGKT